MIATDQFSHRGHREMILATEDTEITEWGENFFNAGVTCLFINSSYPLFNSKRTQTKSVNNIV